MYETNMQDVTLMLDISLLITISTYPEVSLWSIR